MGATVEGWNIDGKPHREVDDPDETYPVDSNPLERHSDSDYLNDSTEYRLGTDPRAERTFAYEDQHRIYQEFHQNIQNPIENVTVMRGDDVHEEPTLGRAWLKSAQALGLTRPGGVDFAGAVANPQAEFDIRLDDGDVDHDFQYDPSFNSLPPLCVQPGGRPDTWGHNRHEQANDLDVMEPDMDSDGLTDAQEDIRVNSCVDIFFIPRASKKAEDWDESGKKDVDPKNNDTDGDGAIDGVEQNEYPSNPNVPDVVHVQIAMDQSFADNHDEDQYIEDRFDEVNENYRENFEEAYPETPYFVLEDSGKWINIGAVGFTRATMDSWRDVANNAPPLQNIPSENDMLALFFDKPVEHVQQGRDPEDAYIDAASGREKPYILQGTEDPLTPTMFVDNYIQHELGHVFGADHTKGDAGNMCKDDCFRKELSFSELAPAKLIYNIIYGKRANIATTTKFTNDSKDSMISSDYDYVDSSSYDTSIREVSRYGE